MVAPRHPAPERLDDGDAHDRIWGGGTVVRGGWGGMPMRMAWICGVNGEHGVRKTLATLISTDPATMTSISMDLAMHT